MNVWKILKTFAGSMPKNHIVFAKCRDKTAMIVSDGWTIMEYKFFNSKPHDDVYVHYTELYNAIHPHRKANIYLDGKNVVVELANSKEPIVIQARPCKEFCSDEVVNKSKGRMVNIKDIINRFDKLSSVAFMPPSDRYNMLFYPTETHSQADHIVVSNLYFHACVRLKENLPFACAVNYNSFCHIVKMLKLLKTEEAYVHFEDSNNELYIWTEDILFAIQALPIEEFYFKPFEITTKIGEFVVKDEIVAKVHDGKLMINDSTYEIPKDFFGQLILSKRRLAQLKGKTCEVYCGDTELVLRIEDLLIRPKQLRGDWHGLYVPDPSNPFIV